MKARRQSDRAFGFTFAGLFIVITVIGWILLGRLFVWTLGLAAGFGMLAWLYSGALMPLNRLWAWIAPQIAILNNTVVLGLIYYCFVTPIALFVRLFRGDPLCRTIQRDCSSYWSQVKRQSDAESFFDQF